MVEATENHRHHEQVCVKVNAHVDEGIADLVAALNSVKGLVTIASCQGWTGVSNAHVYFYFGDWETISRFAFQEIAPAIQGIDGTSISVEIFNESEPMGKLNIRDTVPQVTQSVKLMLSRRMSECSYDRERTMLRNC